MIQNTDPSRCPCVYSRIQEESIAGALKAAPPKSKKRRAPIREVVADYIQEIDRLIQECNYTYSDIAELLRQYGIETTGGSLRTYCCQVRKQVQPDHKPFAVVPSAAKRSPSNPHVQTDDDIPPFRATPVVVPPTIYDTH